MKIDTLVLGPIQTNCYIVYNEGSGQAVVIDPAEEYTAGPFLSKASNSPFAGRRLRGRVQYTICGGRIVYSKS